MGLVFWLPSSLYCHLVIMLNRDGLESKLQKHTLALSLTTNAAMVLMLVVYFLYLDLFLLALCRWNTGWVSRWRTLQLWTSLIATFQPVGRFRSHTRVSLSLSLTRIHTPF